MRETLLQTTLTSFALVSTEKAVTINTLSSLTSSPPPAEVAQGSITARHSSPLETPASPTLSTTSTAEGGSSPALPPLPAPTFNGRTLNLLKTPPSEPQTSRSRYYTASWGSPYPEPSGASLPAQSRSHRKTLSSDISEDSPLRPLELRTPHLRPAPGFARPQTQPSLVGQNSVSAAVLVNRARRPAPGLTDEWIRQHTEADLDTERLNWLSDSNGDSEDSGESVNWIEDEFDPRTPTLKNFVERRGHAREQLHHTRQESTDTVTQTDFENKDRQMLAEMSAANESASVDPLGEMTIARKGTARKLLGHTRAQSTTDVFRQNSSQNEAREPAKATVINNSTAIKSPAETTLGRSEEPGLPVETSSSILDKALPPPPPEILQTEIMETLEYGAASMPAPTEATPAVLVALHTESPAPLPPRLKKKVPWKGKNIAILLPLDDERGQKGKAPTPMSLADVERMLRDWEQLGYNTAGFNIGNLEVGDAPEVQGQSRGVWPDVETMKRERQARRFRVSIPDRRDWDVYVQELREAKLRALGVSLGDDEPSSAVSPATSALSRQASMQYPPLPFSPPIPTSSATSSYAPQNPRPFSPAVLAGADPSTSQSSNVGSIASPPSMHAQMFGKYNPQQSLSLGSAEHPFGSPFQYPQQPSPGVWSPQQMLYQPGLARGASPSVQNLSAVLSPGSPLYQDSYFQQTDLAAQVQQRQQQLQAQLQQQMHHATVAQQSPRLQEVQEYDATSKSPSKTPEASQFIRHNPNNSLQKEIDDAEYHLEEQFQRQLEHDDYSPHSDKEDRFVSLEDIPTESHARSTSALLGLAASQYAGSEVPVLHHPQPHSRGHSLSQRPFGEDEDDPSPALGLFEHAAKIDSPEFETNSSALDTPVLSNDLSGLSHERSFSDSGNPWLDSEPLPATEVKVKPGHAIKPSISKLNVAAPEFKFDPLSTFKPGQFSFSGSILQPAAVINSSFVPLAAPSNQPVKASISGRAGLGSKINVTAPVFTPGKSEFNFSSSGPIFRPDAPAFTPLKLTAESAGSGQSGTEGSDPRISIFGKIDMLSLAGIVKPPKKSKAIPIVRPGSSAGNTKAIEDETMEGNDGRITQGVGRIKRARGSGNDGDSVPLFAEPSPEPALPLQETTRDQSPPKEITQPASTQEDKENLPLESENKALRVMPLSAAKVLRPQSLLENSPDYDGKGWAPWEFQQQQQAEEFSAALAFPVQSLPVVGSQGQNGHVDGEKGDDPNPGQSSAPPPENQKPRGHKKNSLSALAKPFEFATPSWFKFGSSSSPAKQQTAPTAIPVAGLSSSRYAASPSPPPPQAAPESPRVSLDTAEMTSFQASLPQPQSPTYQNQDEVEVAGDREPTYNEIDAVMRHMAEAESARSLTHDTDTPRWHQPSPTRRIQMSDANESSPIRFQPENLLRSDAPSPSPRRFQRLPGDLPGQRVFSRGHEDPFVDESLVGLAFESPVHNLNPRGSLPASDWDDVLSENEEAKFHARTQFFDNHVNDLVGGLLAERLDPLEKVLETIQLSLAAMSAKAPSSGQNRRSVSGELPESDADDEDEDQRRSTSPRRDRKMEKIRSIVTEVLAAHHPAPVTQSSTSINAQESANILQALEDMREQFGQSMRLDLRGEDLRNIVEEAVERRMPASPKEIVDEGANAKIAELEAKIAELGRQAHHADEKAEEEIQKRRAAEDRLAEIQRLLRISSEEEVRLRESLDDKEQKLKAIEDSRSKMAMRTALLDATAQNAQKSQQELANKLSVVENDLRQAHHESQHWRLKAEEALDAAKRNNGEAEITNKTNADLRKTIESLKLQTEESLRVREGMRVKLGKLQEDMARAAREISQENAQRIKKEQELIARQEVLDARLQAEARTRERLEREVVRLENGEREGMRAVSESKRLEELVAGLRKEVYDAQKNSMRYQREFEEARESGLSEVQRTRHYMQAEIESANNQVNIVRQDLEDQVSRLRSELDQVKLDSDTAKERSEMLLEEAEETKRKELDILSQRHENEVEDLQTRHERELGNIVEGYQRSEQQLLERLSLSSAKMEHLQDRVTHLEERLEIAKAAALAAAQAARSASVSPPQDSQKGSNRPISRAMELPEKISPQALRESIMVLQEQLQDREQTIEKLEQKLATVDLDAPSKIAKRDDEITWLRELLAVRIGDLQEIIDSVSEDDFDHATVKDAAIRLKANLQMEEQGRERAMSGTGILPNIASSIREAATPRVAQVVGPMAAAWGNWRKSQETGSTPSRASPQSFLSGLLTPPASSARTPPIQPTAFNSTGRRFTAQQLANRPSQRQGKMPARDDPPATPPMMRKASYDQDARAGDFSDAGFYDDDESTVDDNMFGAGR